MVGRHFFVSLMLCFTLSACSFLPTSKGTDGDPSKQTQAAQTGNETPATTETSSPVNSHKHPTDPVDGPVVIYCLEHSQQLWGRPAGMDDARQGCSPFDESRKLTMLLTTVQIQNRTDQDMLSPNWYAAFFTPEGQQLYACKQGLGALPVIPAGQSEEVTFAIFMEQPVQVTGYVVDPEIGRSNDITY